MPSEASVEGLRNMAIAAMRHAHAPYSSFKVGAALETEDGRRFTGCNIENSSFSVTMCAERVALGTAVAEGARRFRRIAVATAGPEPTPPCGACRQALAEFGLDLEVISVTPNGAETRWTLAHLLPSNFELAERAAGGGSE